MFAKFLPLSPLKRYETSILLSLVLLAGLTGITLLLTFSINTFDELSQSHGRNQIEVAIDVERARLSDLLVEYSYWDEAYTRLVAMPDTAWANSNIGEYLHDSYGIDLALVIGTDDRIGLAFENGHAGANLDSQALFAAIRPLLDDSRVVRNRPSPQHGLILYHNDIYMVAVDTFTPEYEHSRRADDHALLLGRRIDANYIAELNTIYRLPGLHSSDLSHNPDTRLLLRSPEDRVVMVLGWQDSAPATQAFSKVFAPLLLLVLLMIGLGAWILRRDSIRRTRYEQHLQRLAQTDPLTGIYNRRAFYHMVTREMGRVHRDRSDLTMLVLDIDRFKTINDQFGHEAGDRVLQQFTRLIQDNLRDADIFARIGGEEFALALPGTNECQAFDLAERIRDMVANMKTFYELKRIQITVSVGISQYQPGDTHESMIARADRALYHSKENGRNQSYVMAS
jgi:two-component system cell cycle response regulator